MSWDYLLFLEDAQEVIPRSGSQDIHFKTSLLVVNILQFLDDDRLGIFDKRYVLRPMPSGFHYDPWTVDLPRLGIDPRTFEGISYLIAVYYASTSLPSFLSSSVIFINRSKSSSRSTEASSG